MRKTISISQDPYHTVSANFSLLLKVQFINYSQNIKDGRGGECSWVVYLSLFVATTVANPVSSGAQAVCTGWLKHLWKNLDELFSGS